MAEVLGVLPTYMRNSEDLWMTIQTIGSFAQTCDADLIVIDNGSPDRVSYRQLRKLAGEHGFELRCFDENHGFATAVNMGLREARKSGQHALVMNADLRFRDNAWLSAMLANDADVVGALLTYPNGLVQHAGVFFSVITRRYDHIYRLAPKTLAQIQEPRVCPVTGALMLIKHETIKKLGVFDENFKFGYEDLDYCHMAFLAGMKCAYEPKAEVIHHEAWYAANPSDKLAEWMENGWIYFNEKHKGQDVGEFVPTMIWPEEW